MTRRDSTIRTPLKACPNMDCGEPDDLETRHIQSMAHVVCRACGMRGPGGDTAVGAVELWNENLPRLDD